ncbi:MAG: phosphotransferase [Pseudomonadota bacterium]
MTDGSREQLRQTQAEQWLGAGVHLDSASADASFRSYWRARRGDESWILMDAPPAQEDCRPFVAIAGRLEAAGIHAPAVYEQNLADGFLLLEDFGQIDYLQKLTPDNAESLYADAFSALYRIQQIDASDLEPYDEKRLRTEIQLFPEWLLGGHLGRQLDRTFYRHWSALGDTLLDAALSQPRVFVHRDYHSRNLMWLTRGNPGVLDFQDAVLGPVTYDPVSLMRDCYIAWPGDQTDAWLERFRSEHPLPAVRSVDTSTWQHWCDLMGVQRHLKAAGIFCRLHIRDGKPGYLKDIPRTLNHISSVCERHPSLEWLQQLLIELEPTLSEESR